MNTCYVFFLIVIQRILGLWDDFDPEKEFVIDNKVGEIKYQTGTLAKAPGQEEKCKKALLEALDKLQISDEAIQVVNTYKTVEEHTAKARKAVEEMRLLGIVPGQCRICRRLGM